MRRGAQLHLHGAPERRSVPEPRRSAGLPGRAVAADLLHCARQRAGAQQLPASHGDHPGRRGRVCFDPNLRPEVWGNPAEMLPVVREAMALADVVKLSVEELQLLSGLDDLAAGLATLSGPALVLVTRGRGRGGPSGWRVAGVGGAQSDATRYHGAGTPSSPGCWRPWPNGPRCRRWPSCPPFWLRPTAAGRSPPPPRGDDGTAHPHPAG